MRSANGQTSQSSRISTKSRRSRLTALSLICSCGTQKNPHQCSKRVGDVDPSCVANLYGLWDWVPMAPCMGPMSPVRAHSLWAGLCPEKLVNLKTKTTQKSQTGYDFFSYITLLKKVPFSTDINTELYSVYEKKEEQDFLVLQV